MKPSRQSLLKRRQYENWRDKVAKPYLDEKYGRICRKCGKSNCDSCERGVLEVDHIIGRAARPDLKMSLENVQYLCRECHYQKTMQQGRRDFDNNKWLEEPSEI